jgi:hypothetical protein
MIEFINNISSIIDSLTNLVPKIIGFASIAAAFFPSPDGDGFMSKLHKYVNAVAFNFKHAENKK